MLLRCMLALGGFFGVTSAWVSAQTPTPSPTPTLPTWWSVPPSLIRSSDADHDNYRPANLGQLKNFALHAQAHLDDQLNEAGGAGDSINALIAGWTGPVADNYRPINLGQLKFVVDKFYERLDEAGFHFRSQLVARGYGGPWTSATSSNERPWNLNTTPSQNYATANLGQLKILFSFDLGLGADSDNDGMPDWFEQAIIDASLSDDNVGNDLATFSVVTGTDDFDGDGISNVREFQLGSNPTDRFSGFDAALLGRWRLNEDAGTVVEDSTIFGHNGALTGGTWGQDGGRRYASLLVGSDKIEIPASDWEVGADNADFTVDFWVKPTASTDPCRSMIRKGGASGERTFNILFLPNNHVQFRVSLADGTNVGQDSVAALSLTAWTRLTYVRDGGTVKLYVNGALDSQIALAGPVAANAGPITIGSDLYSGALGSYDDLKIYRLALTAAEIASLQNGDDIDSDGDGLMDFQEAKLGTDKNLPDSDWDGVSDKAELADGTNPTDGQSVIPKRLAYFGFESANLASSTGQTPRPAPSGTVNPARVAGFSGWGARIDENSQILTYDWAASGGRPNVSLRRGTFRMWFKPSWSSTGASPMPHTFARLFDLGAYDDNANVAQFVLHFDVTEPIIRVHTADGFGHAWNLGATLDATPIVAGQWQQVVLTYSPTSRKIYVNGVLAGEATGNWNYAPHIADFDAFGLRFGNDGSQPLKGVFDEAEFLNYELTATQVQAQFAAATAGDANRNGLSDAWENTYFNTSAHPAAPPAITDAWWQGDADGDGLTNLEEAQSKTDPFDYYNGETPEIVIVKGYGQAGLKNAFLPKPFEVEIRDPAGDPLVGAPVTFKVSSGGGKLALASTATLPGEFETEWELLTDTNGRAKVWYKQSTSAGMTSEIGITAGKASGFITCRTYGAPEGIWPINEGSGTSFADVSGNSHTGTLSVSGTGEGGATWGTSGGRTALLFGDGKRAEISNSAGLTPGEMTIIAWVKVSAPNSNNNMRIISKKPDWNVKPPAGQSSSISDGGFEMEYCPYGKRLTYCGYKTEQLIAYEVDLGTGWHQVAVTLADDPQSSEFIGQLFVDGQPLENYSKPIVPGGAFPILLQSRTGVITTTVGGAQSVKSPARLAAPLANGYPLTLGRHAYDSVGWNQYWQGAITDVSIHNGVLLDGHDEDHDGLADTAEAILGTNPLLADSDGDGLLDSEEVIAPTITINGKRLEMPHVTGTDPNKFDTNGDGLGDGDSVAAGVDPLDEDTDGDGIPNADEVTRGTNPLLTDSDGDGHDDNHDDFPNDKTRWQASLDSSDHSAPVILRLDSPKDAVPVP